MTTTATVRTRFIARQPIFNCARNVEAYELLFRPTTENSFTGSDLDYASKSVFDMAMLMGVNVLSNGCSVFLNCTRESLVNRYVTLFAPASTVVEVLETVDPDPEVIAACQGLKEAGYRIALDDFVDEPRLAPLAELADFIKVDFRLSSPKTRKEIAKKYCHTRTALLAEKVETHEEFSVALQLGYRLFQGYFFCKPIMLSTRDISGSRATYLRLLHLANAPELDFFAIEGLIKAEPALCYRFLRYLNSAAFLVRTEVKSIVQALTLLGEQDVRKWLTVSCAVLANEGKPPELVVVALVRARFCELLARYTGGSESAYFILGLFSLMDAILGAPLKTILKAVPVPAEVRTALLGGQDVLARTGQLILAFEQGNWSDCEQLARQLHLSEDDLNKAHLSAVEWVQSLQMD